MIKIVADKREDTKRVNALKKFFENTNDVIIEEDVIPVGDYLVLNEEGNVLFAIEWKTFNDLVSSIMNGHIQSQIDDMDKYDKSYLFIVGTYSQWIKHSYTKIPVNNIVGFTTSVTAQHSTRVIQCEYQKEAFYALRKLIAVFLNEKGQDKYKLPERTKRTGDINADMMLSIPGLGVKTVEKLRENKVTFIDLLSQCSNATESPVYIDGVLIKSSIVDYIKRLYK